jgi:sarcosine oxidase subunit gamma
VPEAFRSESALPRTRVAPRGVALAERPEVGKIDLRGDAEDRGFLAAVGRVLDIVLPTDALTSATRGEVTALWVGPDQWLVTCPQDEVAGRMGALREGLKDLHHALTDLSDGRLVLGLEGPSARDVLAKACPLDLHPRAFAPGQCASSRLAKADVLIHFVRDDPVAGPSFDLYVARSFARYLFAWLEDAGLEFGLQVRSA